MQDSLTAYPDSLRIRIVTSGGVTSGVYTVSVVGAGSNGTPTHKRSITLNVNPVGLTQNKNEIPDEFELFQNYPNPFNPVTRIRFNLAKAGMVKLNIFDINGRAIADLINSAYNAGKYEVNFDAENLSSGVYFYKLETAGFSDVKKMLLVK
jgi:hypothetical protein